jgi:lysophospholipid acyltransferase (LPLAT)-like uncharacterized protein
MLTVIPRVAAFTIRALLATLRYQVILEPGAQTAFEHPKPCIFVFWHRALLPSSAYFGPLKIAIMISQSFDGELIARTSQRLGYVPVRGSSSRGGASGLEALHQAFTEGRLISLTVDGPRGPKYVAKPGAVKLAQLTGSPISAFYTLPQRAWTLKSWDEFLIPKPFSRVVVTYPKPVAFNPDFDAMMAEVQTSLERSVQMAEQHWSSTK